MRGAVWRSRLVVILVVGVLTACAVGPPPPPGAIVVAMTNSALDLDPRVAADEASQKVHQLLYNTLVRIDDNLRIVPDVAESLEQPDPLTYIATMRRGVRFHNGRELTAADVVYTFGTLIDPTFRGRTGAYRLLGAVEALDPYTVRFTLKEPFASFPINLVMGIVQDGSGAANSRTPIGTGPYRLSSFAPDALPAADAERRALYGRAQQLIADDLPYIPLWYRTNVVVSQSDIRGVSLSPIADFAFLKDVYRVRPQ